MSELSRNIVRRPVHSFQGKHSIRPILATVLMLAAMSIASPIFAAQPTPANAHLDAPTTTIVVDSLDDLPDPFPDNGICESDGAGCTLRAAIQTAQGTARPGADIIDLSGLSGAIRLTFGSLPPISEDLTISGPADADTLQINATGEYQHLTILPDVTVEIARVHLVRGFGDNGGAISNEGILTLSGVVITNSSAMTNGGAIYCAPGSITTIQMGSEIGRFDFSNTAAYGGAIYNDDGIVYIDDSSVNNNSAYTEGGGDGGGIYNDAGSLYVDGFSVIENNYAGGDGGGIYNIAGGLVKITSSTITDNQADADGGGMYNYYSTQTLTNATISGNSAKGNGGGILEESTDTANLYNVTVTNNVADSDANGTGNGGGIFISGFINIANTIVAQNEDRSIGTPPIHPDCSVGAVFYTSTNTHNLIGNGAGCTTLFVNGASGNQVGTPSSPLDAVLGPLVFDPSGALMHAILNGSPAKDAGDPTGCKDDVGALLADDQRGISRPQDLYCDVGAYEAALPVTENQAFNVAEFSPNGTLVGTVAASDADGAIVSFAITAGNTNGAFAIDSAGTLTVANSAAIDPAVNPSFALTVVVTDNDGYTASATMTVTVTGSPFIVRNTNDSGPGSLRAAMLAANAAPGVETITFAIDGAGPHVITPTTPLPALLYPADIDGSTQPAGEVVVDGSLAGTEADGIDLWTYDSTINGLTIRNFSGNGIFVQTPYRAPAGIPLLNIIENTITGNDGDGVLVATGSYASILNNSIYDNGRLGIDLGGDGVTPNDVGDPDVGASLLQNYPVLLRAEPGKGFWVDGRLNSLANLDFTLDFFASAECDPAGFGEGQHYLGSRSVATDEAGNVRFGVGLPDPPPDSPFITATSTDENGNTSEFSQCIVTGPNNDSWPRAYRLNPALGENQTVSFSQYIDKLGQSRWFKFHVEPDSKVTVDLSSMPDNYDIILYRDIAAAFQDLITEDDLLELQAKFAPEMYSPEMYSPEMYSPEMYSPEMYSPEMYSPEMYSPEMYSPEMYSPEMYSPEMYSPEMYSPDAQNPDMYSPEEHDPNAFAPNNYNPNVFVENPQAYASAQNRSMITISAFGGTAPERIVANTWLSTGDFYVRVRGRNGTFNLSAPFTLDVSIQYGLCTAINSDLVPSSTIPTAGNFKSIILVDPSRIQGSPAEIAAMLAKLQQLADSGPQVQGVLVDVSQDARVAAANAQADQNPDCPYAKNLVADAIKQIVTAYRGVNPLVEYVVLVGNDDVIPFFRSPDQAQLASESTYVPPVFNGTHSQSSLRLAYVWSQDFYGSSVELPFLSQQVAVPELAVGRLVETPNDVINVVDAFLDTNGVVATPNTAFVSGYDFLTDAAQAVQSELEEGLGGPISTLISPADVSPEDPLAWTADQLRAQLLGSRHDLIFLAGHFSAAGTLAADYQTRMISQDVLSSTVDFENAIVWSAGCHSGYNIVNSAGVPNVTQEPDWAQTFAKKGATLIAGTGFQYGDTDFVEYSERLYVEFTKHLRYGTGPVSLGKALVGAKQTYLETTPRLRGIHVKSVQQATLFGLPMLAVDLPFGRVNPPPNPPVIPGTSGYTSDPGATLNLLSADLTVTPSLIEHTRQLSDTTNLAQLITVTYLEGSDGVAVNPAEPVLPLEKRNIDVPGYVLRGIGFRSGSYTDQGGVVPLTGAPTTEVRGIHYPFRSKFFFPIRPWGANYFDALSNPGGATNLFVTPAQFKIDDPTGTSGTLRKFGAMGFRLFYSNNLNTYGGNVPAQTAPPEIAQVNSITNTNSISFSVRVSSDPSAGIQEVWVTYTGVGGAYYGAWQSLDLTQNPLDSTLWEGTLTGVTESTDDVRFMVQAVNGVGLVTAITNYGDYFLPGVDSTGSSETGRPTSLAMTIAPTSAPYSSEVVFAARLTADGPPAEDIVPLPGETVSFAMGAQRRSAVTNANGVATVTLPVVGLVGPEELRVSYEGTAEYRQSTLTHTLTVTKKSTFIDLQPIPANGQYSDDPDLRTKLTREPNEGLSQKTLFFVFDTPAETQPGNAPGAIALTENTITDYAGRVPVGSIALPGGVYPFTVYFMGDIPVGNGDSVFLEDTRYFSSTVSGTLVQTPEDATVSYTGPTAVASGAALDASAMVTQAGDGMPGDLTLAAVEYVVRDSANQVVATVTGSVTGAGVSQATIPGLPDGTYTLTVQVVGGYFASPISAPIQITVGTASAVDLSGFNATGSDSFGWLPWLVALIGLGVILLAGLKQLRSIRRPT